MKRSESIQEFYNRKGIMEPTTYDTIDGHFNIFKLDPYVGKAAKPVPYIKRDYYKIMIIKGHCKFYYADKTLEIKKKGLVFSNPSIPYSVEHLNQISGGYFCIFNKQFISSFLQISKYSVFQPKGEHVFEINTQTYLELENIYKKMFDEINSDYLHKYDVLRNLMFEIVHIGLKRQPLSQLSNLQINASQRIHTLFLELLERQFPLDENHASITLRSPSSFAKQLNIHTNHLNKAIKEVSSKTTGEIIAVRILQESKILLRQSAWNISEIGYALGFKEASHFNNFFKKYTDRSPVQFRKTNTKI